MRLRAGIAVLCCVLAGPVWFGGSADAGTPAAVGAATKPSGPAAELTPLAGGNGVFLGEAAPPDFTKIGYVQREYAASGTATSYAAAGPSTGDGRWTWRPDGTAPYRTRVLVRAPAQPARFSGNVVVEWLNVSGGVDAGPDWTSTAEELVRSGDVWVGVSAQRIGVEGGPVLVTVNGVGAGQTGKGLKGIDPARYGMLQHPGDGFAFDIFTQVARAVRGGRGLTALHPKRVIAAGESQSAIALVSYYNGVQPLTHAYDGFFVHSRGATGLPIAKPGGSADLAGSLGRTPTTFRTDQDAPILDIQTETDVASVLDSYAARQPDTPRFRLWEVAGTAHADAHLLGAITKSIDCGVPVNNGPMHVVAKAALHALKAWLTTGKPPRTAPRLDVSAGPPPTVQRAADGIALGGIRTPPVDVPVATLSGRPGPNPSVICLLLGSTTPFTPAQLARRYPSRTVYLGQYRRAVAVAIRSGFVLRADRGALMAYADPGAFTG